MSDPAPRFGGETYEPEHDEERLTTQLRAIRRLMRDGEWRTLREISDATGAPEASVSARLRDLRKWWAGGWTVEKRPRFERKRGLYEYRVIQPETES